MARLENNIFFKIALQLQLPESEEKLPSNFVFSYAWSISICTNKINILSDETWGGCSQMEISLPNFFSTKH